MNTVGNVLRRGYAEVAERPSLPVAFVGILMMAVDSVRFLSLPDVEQIRSEFIFSREVRCITLDTLFVFIGLILSCMTNERYKKAGHEIFGMALVLSITNFFITLRLEDFQREDYGGL